MRSKQGWLISGAFIALAMSFWAGRVSAPTAADESIGAAAPAANKNAASQAAHAPSHSRTAVSINPPPLPAPGLPLKTTIADLESRAAAGDASAASRLYRDTQRCAQARLIGKTVPKIVSRYLAGKAQSTALAPAAEEDEFLAGMQRQLDFLNDSEALCADLTQEQIDSAIPAELHAAQLGDNEAANCYLTQGFGVMPQEMLDHPEWLTDFRDHALEVAQTALRNGDWMMVNLLQGAYADEFGFNRLAKLTGNDPAQAYAYKKLQVLGAARADTAQIYARELTELGKQLSAQDMQSANAWAEEAFRNDFASTKNTSGQNASNTCGRLFP